MSKKLYRVVASQLVFHECFVEADSLEDAEELAWEDSQSWKEFAFGDWELEDVELAKETA
jgi:hypothetical protein